MLAYVNRAIKNKENPKLLFVDKDSEVTKQEQLLNLVIGNLIGKPLCWTQEQDEITIFRQNMCRYIIVEKQQIMGSYVHTCASD